MAAKRPLGFSTLRMAATLLLVLVLPCHGGVKFNIGKALDKAKEIKDDKRLKQLKALLPISLDEEIELGERVAAKIQHQYGVYHHEPLERYVALVGTAVSWQGERKEIKYSYTILDSDEINAFAAPGGFVMITRGLLEEMRNEAELACVLGHETWHVEDKDEIRRVEKAQRVGILASEAISAMSDQELGEVADYCYSILEKGRSREDEFQADAEGVRFAAGVGYAPHAMSALLGRLKKEPAKTPLKKLQATHPAMGERIDMLNRQEYDGKASVLLEKRFQKNVVQVLGS